MMKSKTSFTKESRKAWSLYYLTIKGVFLCALILAAFLMPVKAQNTQDAKDIQYTKPSWMFGLAGGTNLNFYRGSTQKLNDALTIPVAFHYGQGLGLFVAPLVEFRPQSSRFGVMLQLGYDNRKGTYDQVTSPCNCPTDLASDLSYISAEPSLRFAPERSNFYLFAGPRFAYNLEKAFTYKLGINPDFPDQEPHPDVIADFSDMNKFLVSMQAGVGYDIFLSSQKRHTQFVLSPFISYHPYFGQNPRSIETWNISTLRAGIAFKFGRGKEIVPIAIVTKEEVKVIESGVQFTVNSPTNIPKDRRVRETFPIRNYVFFDLGSTEIPGRYILLKKDEVKEFNESRLEVFSPKNLTGRSGRQMEVYYNILNILGSRMVNNPKTIITLNGSSEQGAKDGVAMAESVKKYLVDVFGIEAWRITTLGSEKPLIPSLQEGGTLELGELREGDRRVTIESKSPELVMEFQSGPDTPLKPVELDIVQEAPIESYVTFNVKGAKEAYSSWSLYIMDETGNEKFFGPYYKEKVSIPGKSILGTRSEGDFIVTMVGQLKNGKAVERKEAVVHMTLWTPGENEQGMRYSVLYEFDDANAIQMYDKYLTEVVTPKIPVDAKVIIHGYTDNIGDEDHNLRLSQSRANDVKRIIEKALVQKGRKDVKFEVYGYGEDQTLSPFNNTFPEERFYNRTVIIDIIPTK